MNISHKIKLIEKLHLNTSDLKYLDVIKLSHECLEELMLDNTKILKKEFRFIIENPHEADDVRLVAACYYNILLRLETSEVLDKVCEDISDVPFGLIGPNEDDSYLKEREEIAKEKQKLWKKRENNAKAAQKKLEKMSSEEICNEIFSYILKKYPELENGYNAVLYRSGREDYYEMLSIRYCPTLVSHQEWTKINIAAKNVENKLRKYADMIILDQLEYWIKEYKEWANDQGYHRVTKVSINSFFREKNKKVSSNVIDKLKSGLECSE